VSKQKRLITPTPPPAIQERESSREVSPVLSATVEAAVKDQPEFAILRIKLLEHAGSSVRGRGGLGGSRQRAVKIVFCGCWRWGIQIRLHP